MAMENGKVVYSSTSDFLQYLSARTKEKEKPENRFTSVNKDSKKRNSNLYPKRYN